MSRELPVSTPSTRITRVIYHAWDFLMWVLEIDLRPWASTKALAVIFFNGSFY